MDENGVPDMGRKPWRHYRVEQLLFDAVAQLKVGKSSIICGMIFPHEVIDSETYKPELNLHFLTLISTKELIRKRLSDRIAANGDRGRFDEDFEETRILEAFDTQRLLINQTQSLRNGHVIDSGPLSLQALHDQAELVVKSLAMPKATS